MPTQSEQLASAIAAITQLNQTFIAEVANWQLQRTSMQTLLNQAVAAVPNLIKTYYVDLINGNDSNAGTSAAAPFATLSKALDLADNMSAGKVIIYLSEGVHEWSSSRTFQGIELVLLPMLGLPSASSNNIIVNCPENITNYFLGGVCRLQGITLRRTGLGGSESFSFVILYFGAVLACGLYAAGITSSQDNQFKYIFDTSPLVRVDRGFGFFTVERGFIECLNATAKPLWGSKNQLLVALSSTVSSNVVLPQITLSNVKAGVA